MLHYIFKNLALKTKEFFSWPTMYVNCFQMEYDNYISKLLDQQSPDHTKKLRTQAELMLYRGTSRPQELQEAENKVSTLEEKAKSLLETNERCWSIYNTSVTKYIKAI